MKKIGFLGCGKIGAALLRAIREDRLGEVVFIQDPFLESAEYEGVAVARRGSEELYRQADLVIESATAPALMENIGLILTCADLFPFSVTAFGDADFEENTKKLARKFGRHIFIPHGAILGLDGIWDGKKIWEQVSVETTKNPKSLGRDDRERTVLYRGSTREACRLFPRNVNVHAAVALTGIGFDRTRSVIISDPAVQTNTHIVRLSGMGTEMQIRIGSDADSGVTGRYTPVSACGNLKRLLDGEETLGIV